MSEIRRGKITCRNCGKKFDADIYNSVNVDIDPELREPFLFDELYIFECPHCKERMYQAYPILYHDMKNKFMVQSGTYSDIFGFYNFAYGEPDNEMAQIIKKAKEGYKYVGATSPILAREKVVALENGLDHRIVAIYRYNETYAYNKYAEKNNKPRCEESYLCYDDDGNLSVIFGIYDDETMRPTCLCKKFDRDLYDNIKESLEEYLDEANDFLFNDSALHNFIKYCETGFLNGKPTKQKYALIREKSGIELFVMMMSNSEYKIGDIVKLDINGNITEGKILDFCEFTEVNAPFDLENMKQCLIK